MKKEKRERDVAERVSESNFFLANNVMNNSTDTEETLGK